MALEIKLLNLIDIEPDSSFVLLTRNMGIRTVDAEAVEPVGI
jgi:hypothetical protein